jgi:hypothetical protein
MSLFCLSGSLLYASPPPPPFRENSHVQEVSKRSQPITNHHQSSRCIMLMFMVGDSGLNDEMGQKIFSMTCPTAWTPPPTPLPGLWNCHSTIFVLRQDQKEWRGQSFSSESTRGGRGGYKYLIYWAVYSKTGEHNRHSAWTQRGLKFMPDLLSVSLTTKSRGSSVSIVTRL